MELIFNLLSFLDFSLLWAPVEFSVPLLSILPMIQLILSVILVALQYPAVQPNTDEGAVVKVLSSEGSI